MRGITIREVAQLAGVSQATAARALNGYGSVSEETMRRVTTAAGQLGYTPNSVAQALRRGQSQLIGFVPSDLQNPFFSTVARNVADRVEAAGYTLLISSSDEDINREQRIVENLRATLVSGIMVAPALGANKSHLIELGKRKIPLVLIDREIAGLHADVVKTENVDGSRAAVDHLLDRGHRRIALLIDDLRIPSSAERLAGYRTALGARGFSVDESLVISTRSAARADCYQAAHELLTRSETPTAIFAGDNYLTLSVVRVAHDLGLSIPDQLSLVGFDDFDFAAALRPALTVVAQPVAELGCAAAELMLKRLAGDSSPAIEISLPTTLIERGSTSTV